MPRQARGEVIDPSEVQVVHCIQRCVRRAFLCGDDPVGGQYPWKPTWSCLTGQVERSALTSEVVFRLTFLPSWHALVSMLVAGVTWSPKFGKLF